MDRWKCDRKIAKEVAFFFVYSTNGPEMTPEEIVEAVGPAVQRLMGEDK